MRILGELFRGLRASIRERHERQEMLQRYARKRSRRKPPEAGVAVPAIQPKGPLPQQGGAEAPLEFDG